jgi:hypothetical protein
MREHSQGKEHKVFTHEYLFLMLFTFDTMLGGALYHIKVHIRLPMKEIAYSYGG